MSKCSTEATGFLSVMFIPLNTRVYTKLKKLALPKGFRGHMKELSFVTEVDSRGRITIPQTIRTLLGLKESDFVRIGNVQKVSKEEEN